MLTNRVAYLLTPEAQNLVDAGFVDVCDGGITNAGRSELWLILMKAYAAEFQAAAKRVIDERKAKANQA